MEGVGSFGVNGWSQTSPASRRHLALKLRSPELQLMLSHDLHLHESTQRTSFLLVVGYSTSKYYTHLLGIQLEHLVYTHQPSYVPAIDIQGRWIHSGDVFQNKSD